MVILVVAALIAAIGGTMAWLTDSPVGITNTFEPAKIKIAIHENESDGFPTDKTGTTKENVHVQNESSVPIYVRVALVPTWEDAQGTAVAYPASLGDLDITWGTDGWYTDGEYYYHTSTVAAGTETKNLIVSAYVDPESAGYTAGYHMNLQVLAQAIQAEGIGKDAYDDAKKPVKLAWGFDPAEKPHNLPNS